MASPILRLKHWVLVWRIWFCACGFFIPAVSPAQSLRGGVVDARDSSALAGVVVQLLDSSGVTVSRALTNERGEFRLIATRPGWHRVRTLRIGYRSAESGAVLLDVSGEVTHQIVLVGIPTRLATIRVAGRPVCTTASDSAAAAFAIWEQARTALTATQLTARVRGAVVTTILYERTLGPDMRRIRQQSASVRTGGGVTPWRSMPADSLRLRGYVTTGGDGWITYYAPDIDVLVSQEFAEDHCLRIAASKDGRLIGVAFEPTPDRTGTPEIRGTLWVDRQSAELRSLEFTYTNVSSGHAANAGGEMQFVRLVNGTWLISRWSIRMPAMRQVEIGGSGIPGGIRQFELRMVEVKVAGGELALVTRGRDTLWAHAPVVMSGTIVDSVTGLSITGARIGLKGTGQFAVSNARGHFVISHALPGEYTIEVTTPSLDSIGATHQTPLTLTGAANDVRLRVPSADRLLPALCGPVLSGTFGSTLGVVTGTVRVPGDSAPPVNTRVVVQWKEFALKDMGSAGVLVRETTLLREARTRDNGSFRVCGLPTNTPARVVAGDQPRAAAPVRIPAPGRFARVEVVLDRWPEITVAERTARDTSTVAPEATVAQDSVYLAAPTSSVMASGPGHIITRTQLAKAEGRRVSELLAIVPGVRIERGEGGEAWVASSRSVPAQSFTLPTQESLSRRENPSCYADVWIDDSRLFTAQPGERRFDINALASADIERIEFYSGEAQVPVRYSRSGIICALVVIRTRFAR